jgi:hypothetical protein
LHVDPVREGCGYVGKRQGRDGAKDAN